MDLKEIAEILTRKYPYNKFDFKAGNLSEHACRYLFSCIIVAGDAEDRVFSTLPMLFNNYPSCEAMAFAEIENLRKILELHNIKYAARKAEFLQKTASILHTKFHDSVPQNRDELERLPGVGRHIANVILATVFDQNYFAVDHHARRILNRLGVVDTKSDIKIEECMNAHLDPKILGHFSRSLVDFGQDICGFTTRCNICQFNDCPSRNIKNKSRETKKRTDMEVELFQSKSYPQKSHAVTIRNGRYRCTCPSYKFHFKCSHIKTVKNSMNK